MRAVIRRLGEVLLGHGTRRVVTSHAIWGLSIGAVALPLAMWAGYEGRSSAWDPSKLERYMNETAQPAAAAVMPGRDAAKRLFVLGETVPRSAIQNGETLWVASYPARSERAQQDALEKVDRAWRRDGIELRREGMALLGEDARNDFSVAALALPEQGLVQVHVRERDEEGAAAAVSLDLFRMHGLPVPPNGAEMMNFSSPDAAPMLCFEHRASVNKMARHYLGALESAGWRERPLGPGEAAARGAGVLFKSYGRDHRYITVAITSADGGGSLVAVTVMG